jgi:hypothetical protein
VEGSFTTRPKNIKRINSRKRFEFILGAWCMNDEATPTYSAIITFMIGLKTLET